MRRLARTVSFALFAPWMAAAAQVTAAPARTAPAAVAQDVRIDVLSDANEAQLGSYLGGLAPALTKSFEERMGADGRGQGARQQVDVLATLGADGELLALRLAPGTEDSASARAAWEAAKAIRFAPLPSSVRGAAVRLRLHFSAA